MAYIHDRPDHIPQEDSQRDSLDQEMADEDAEIALDALYGDYLPDEHLEDDGFGDY